MFNFVNFDLFAVFAIFIWIRVSVAQWYFGFNRIQLGIYSDTGYEHINLMNTSTLSFDHEHADVHLFKPF